MLFGIDFLAFLTVTAASLVATVVVVALYALGIRLHVLAEPLPEDLDPDTPAHEIMTDTGTIIVVTPLNKSRQKLALWGARICYTLSGLAVLFGIFLIIPVLHSMFW
ncbi:MAG: hypothetical protein WBA28_04195 [Microbacteriaceae bacterium]